MGTHSGSREHQNLFCLLCASSTCHSRPNVPFYLFLCFYFSIQPVRPFEIAEHSFRFIFLFYSFSSSFAFSFFHFLSISHVHSFFCLQFLTFTTRDIFHLQSNFFLFLFLLHWLLAIFFSIILYSYLFSYFHVYNSVFLDSFISTSYFICLQFIYSFSHLTIDIYNLFMCFVPSFLLSFKYSCKYSFFDSLLIIHIILILFSEYSDVNKSIFDGSYTATIFLKLTCSLLMLIWFDMWMHFYT